MSLIECFECQKEVSELAVSCPHCGYPLAKKRVQAKLSQAIDHTKKFVEYKLDVTNEKYALLASRMTKCVAPISLRRVNGIGLRLGSVQQIYKNGVPTKYAFGFLVITFLFMPIFPLGFNIVEPIGGGYKFVGDLSFNDAHDVFGKNIAWQAVSKALFEAALYIGLLAIILSFIFLLRRNSY